MKIEITRTELNLIHAAGNDTRYGLNQVQAGKDFTMATDGHILVVAKPPAERSYLADPVGISGDNAAKVLGSAKCKRGEEQTIQFCDQSAKVGHLVIGLDPQSADKFPEWRRVTSAVGRFEKVRRVCLGPDLLSRLFKAMQLKKLDGVILEVNDEESPVLIRGTSETGIEMLGVAMPMRFKKGMDFSYNSWERKMLGLPEEE